MSAWGIAVRRYTLYRAMICALLWLLLAVAAMLMGEAKHYAASGLSNPKPNGMNNYGIKWSHIGLGGLFERLRER